MVYNDHKVTLRRADNFTANRGAYHRSPSFFENRVFHIGLLRLRLVPLVPSNEEQLVDLSEGRYDPTYPYELSDNVQRMGYIGPGQSEAMGYPITNDALR